MSNIQKFEDAFAVNFPIDVADQILGHMQNLYGDLFDKRYRNTDSEQLKQTLCSVLNGISPEDLQRGIQRMSKEKWCPTLPEFAEWCVDDGHWWTADIAWAKALNLHAQKQLQEYWDSNSNQQATSFLPLQLRADVQKGSTIADQAFDVSTRQDREAGRQYLLKNLDGLNLSVADKSCTHLICYIH